MHTCMKDKNAQRNYFVTIINIMESSVFLCVCYLKSQSDFRLLFKRILTMWSNHKMEHMHGFVLVLVLVPLSVCLCPIRWTRVCFDEINEGNMTFVWEKGNESKTKTKATKAKLNKHFVLLITNEMYMKLLAFYNHFPFFLSVCVCISVLRFSQHVHCCIMCLCICDDNVCMHTLESLNASRVMIVLLIKVYIV